MPKPNNSFVEMRRLYEVERLTLQEIAGRFNISKQAVHFRLKAQGVDFRRPGNRPPFIDRIVLEELYIEKRFSAQKIADQLSCQIGKVYHALNRHGINRRERGYVSRKYPQLRDLKIGESIEVPRPKSKGKYQSHFYPMAKSLGIRVSVTTIDEQIVRLTRVE